MDIQQQTKNVAAQGRFGDSMLLHVNPAEVKGLASAVPLTVNPETGQPEAFLPFLAPVLGSMLGGSLLTGATIGGLTLSAGAAAGLGAGLATYAQTGGSGSKALLSGLTAGLGTRALQGAAQGTQAGVDAAISTPPVDPSFVGPMPTPVTPPVAPPIDRSITAGESLKSMFTQPDVAGQVGGFDAGMKSLAGAAMSPSGMAAGTAAGTAGVIASQEEFERQMAQMGLDEEERKRKMYEMYPEQIPMASGGRTGFYHGGTHNPRIDAQRAANNIVFDVPDTNYSNINYGLDGIGGGFNAYSTPARRTTRPISRGFMPGFMPEYSYFEGMNPSATALGYDPLGNFQNPQSVNQTVNFGGPSQLSRERGGFGGLLGGSRRGYRPQPATSTGFPFAGYGNPFMQSPSYQGFYGVPQMQQMINPYAAFSQMPMPYQPYQPYTPPVETPPDDGGGTGGGGTGGGGTPPIDPPIDIPGDGLGRKGTVTNPDPIAPPDDFVNPIVNPPVGGPAEPPITPPITMPPMPPSIGRPGEPPINVPGGTPGFYDTRPGIQPPGDIDFGGKPGTPPVNTPPPTITIPIEGGADVTIPDFSRPQPPRIEPPINENPIPFKPPSIDRIGSRDDEIAEDYSGYLDFYNRPPPGVLLEPARKKPEPPMSIDRIGNYDLDRKFGNVPINAQPAPTDDMARLAPAQLASMGAPISQNTLDQLAENINMSNGINNQTFYDTGERISQEEALASAIANGAGRPVAPPVQSVTTPQPFLQKQYPEPFKDEAIKMTPVTMPNLNGEMQTVNIGNYNLPSGPTAPPSNTGRQIPSGPAMGGISAVPTPAAPPQNVGNNPPPMSIGGPGGGRGGIFGAPMFAEGGDTDLPNEGLKALAKTEKGREAVEAMGYQEGGQTDMMQDPVTQDVIMFILGETDNENAINAFVEKYGAEQFMFLRDKILKQAAGNPDAQTEGLIQGNGNSGMADDLPMNIGDKPIAAVSQDEYIIPADVVSMLGDGSSDAGSKQLDGMLDRVRQAKTGGKTQAPPLNPQKVMPA